MSAKVAQILIVEDEPSIGQGLCDVLVFRGYKVSWEKDGQLGLKAALENQPDLVLLDLMLPSLDGYSVCQQMRASGSHSGVIMLTAKGAEEDVLRGFESGADDYVTKPFSIGQLLARVEAVLGRSRRAVTETWSAGDLLVRPEHAIAEGPKGQTPLSAKELEILRLLMDDPSRIVSRRTLLRQVWGMSHVDGVETRTVDVHMGKLRKKIADISGSTVQAVRGQGYRFVIGENGV
jgi:DNA-binding response OmpR family regulator